MKIAYKEHGESGKSAAKSRLRTRRFAISARASARVLLILIAVALSLSLIACDAGDDKADADAEGVSTASESGSDNGGAGGDDSGNGGGDSSGGIGGDSGDNGGVGGGDSGIGGAGGDSGVGGGSSADDTQYTEPTYSAETTAQLDSFQAIVSGLPMDDVNSAIELFNAFRDLASDGGDNDALFFAYEAALQSVGDSFNESILENGPPGDDTVNGAIENGFMYVGDAPDPHFSLRPDFLFDTFNGYVSPAVDDLLALRKKHYDFAGGHEFLENDTIMVTLDQLAEMIVDWEGFLYAREDIADADDIKNNLDFYLRVYVGAYQIENSGFYVDVGLGVDGLPILKLADEPRQSYLLFLENYSGSMFWPIIDELVQTYENGDYLYSVAIETFFLKYGLAVPI